MPKLKNLSVKQSAKEEAAAAQHAVREQYVAENPDFAQDVTGIEEANQIFSPEAMAAVEKDMEMQRKYGNSEVEAFAEGALRGAVPLADQILTKGFGVSPERLQNVKEANPISAATGEIATLVGGAVAGGGTSALGKATLGGSMMGAEKAIANSIAKNVFKNQAERKIFQTIVEKGAANAVSGAAYGANQLLNENALGEADLTGENVLAYAGTGALLNGLVGGAFGAGEHIIPAVKTAADKATGQLKRQLQEAVDPIKNFTEYVSDSTGGRIELGEIVKKMEKPNFDNFLKNDIKFPQAKTHEELLRNTKQFMKDGGEQLKSLHDVVDSISPQGIVTSQEVKPRLLQSLNDFQQKYINEFDSAAAKKVFQNQVDTLGNTFERIQGPMTANQLWDMGKTFGKLGKSAFSDGIEARLASRLNAHLFGSTKEILEESIEKATANTEKAGIVQEIRDLNSRWRLAKNMVDDLEKKANRKTNFLDFKSSLMGTLGAVTGGPIGATVAALGTKYLSSDAFKKTVAMFNTAQRANSESLKKVSSVIKSVVGTGAKSSAEILKAVPKSSLMYSGLAVNDKRQAPKNDKEAFKNLQTNLLNLKLDPQKMVDKVAASTLSASYSMPNVTRSVQTAMMRGINFLHDKMPRDMNYGTDITGKREWEPSSVEMAKFKRYVQTVEHPYSILTDLEKGTITREHVEALQTVYPSIYNQIRDTLLTEIAESPHAVPYQRKVQIGIMLNAPTDFSLRPSTIAELQSNFMSEEDQAAATGAPKPNKGAAAIEKSSRMMTGMQEAEGGIEE